MIDTLRTYRFGLIAVAIFIALLASSLTIVGEDRQVVIERLGTPDRVINRFRPGEASGAGLIAHIPLFERAISLPRGLVTFSHGGKRVQSANQQWLLLDTDVTYRIIDPVKLVDGLGGAAGIDGRLQALLPDLLDSELAKRNSSQIAGPGAGGANAAILRGLDTRTRQFGIQIVDLRIARVSLDKSGIDLVYQRMNDQIGSEVEAIKYRSYADAAEVTARAEAEAATLRQSRASQNQEFYAFFKAMRSYEALYGDPKRPNTTTIVLPPDSGYLKHFGGK